MRRVVMSVLVLTFAVLLTTPGLTQSHGFKSRGWVEAYLLGYNEVPSISTQAWGRFSMKVYEDKIDYELRLRGLEGNAVSAHIHFGQPGTNGGVMAWLCGNPMTPECPSHEGLLKGTITRDDIVGPANQGIGPGEYEKAINAILIGSTYVNVHTDLWPTGEIRGQVRRGLAASPTIALP